MCLLETGRLALGSPITGERQDLVPGIAGRVSSAAGRAPAPRPAQPAHRLVSRHSPVGGPGPTDRPRNDPAQGARLTPPMGNSSQRGLARARSRAVLPRASSHPGRLGAAEPDGSPPPGRAGQVRGAPSRWYGTHPAAGRILKVWIYWMSAYDGNDTNNRQYLAAKKVRNGRGGVVVKVAPPRSALLPLQPTMADNRPAIVGAPTCSHLGH